jgi:pimeloyl-ACP methyl ester carboxylesterase
MSAPQVRYARSGDVNVAYHVIGDGSIDLVLIMGALTNLNVLWDLPAYRRFLERLAEFTRVLVFDKRGMGLSDRVEVGTLEERMDDVRAVMDAAGSEQAALMGISEGGPMSLLFAATYPERTRGLVLCGAEIREETTPDWPWGEHTREEFEESMAGIQERWGTTGKGIGYIVPSLAGVEWAEEWFLRLLVESATPRTAEAFQRMAFAIDIRDIVPAVHVPALILHRVGDGVCHVENARWLARHLSDARYLELEGDDHVPWYGDPDQVLAEIREFLTGTREAEEPDRVLATVLFTDVVGSTERAAELGDRRWRELLTAHNDAVAHELVRFRGRHVDSAGDGVFATFDGPARAIRCAAGIRDAVRPLGLEIRAGVHTGEVEVLGDDLAGMAVHIGARVSARAAAGEILVSGTVRDLVVGSGVVLEDRGAATLKGVPGEWRLYAVTAAG